MEEIFKRSSKNPIITLNDLPFNIHSVLNPGATEFGNEIILLIRVEHSDGISNIHVARSKNGVDGWQIEYTPILEKGENWHYEEWGCEDARITYLPDKAAWYITYTAYSSAGAAVGLACTRDFVSAERVGLIFSPNNKDAVLFPTKFNGNYAVLHRPDAGGIQNIWIAFSPDLKFWGEPHAVLLEGGGPAWNGVKVGSGPPPVETKEGWLLLFHGAKYYGNNLVYRTGAVLLDKDKPHKIKAILPYSIFSSKEPYEMTGLMPNVLFPTGLLLRGDELWLYYGAADSSICLATVNLQTLLNLFE